MKKCGKCGNDLVDGAMFCGNCGARIEAEKQACSGCGNDNITSGQRFCQTCGRNLSALATPEESIAKATMAPVKSAPATDSGVLLAPASPAGIPPVDDSLFDMGGGAACPVMVITGPDGGQCEFPLTKDNMFIGSDAKADIALKDEYASRRHAQISRNADGQYVISDLGSRNGLFVLTKECALSDGFKVLVGRHILEFKGRV